LSDSADRQTKVKSKMLIALHQGVSMTVAVWHLKTKI